jgi:hypothetical protein
MPQGKGAAPRRRAAPSPCRPPPGVLGPRRPPPHAAGRRTCRPAVQESNAERALEALKELQSDTAHVLRGGKAVRAEGLARTDAHARVQTHSNTIDSMKDE